MRVEIGPLPTQLGTNACYLGTNASYLGTNACYLGTNACYLGCSAEGAVLRLRVDGNLLDPEHRRSHVRRFLKSAQRCHFEIGWLRAETRSGVTIMRRCASNVHLSILSEDHAHKSLAEIEKALSSTILQARLRVGLRCLPCASSALELVFQAACQLMCLHVQIGHVVGPESRVRQCRAQQLLL
eukprot:3824394-Pleurochrysis_carterae.AAC.1